MLPNLKSLQKLRLTAATPVLASSKRLSLKTDNQEIDQLRQQVDLLQKQLESVQSNKSFVMKISNQQCTYCQKLRHQLEMQHKNEQQLKQQYENRIEELKKSQHKPQKLFKAINEADTRFDQLLEQLKKVSGYDLFVTQQPETLTIQKQLDSSNQKQDTQKQELQIQTIIQLQKELKEMKQSLQDKQKEYDELNISFDKFKQQHKNCFDQIYQLRMKLEFNNNVRSSSTNSYHLPDDIVRLKRNIDQTIENNMVQQLVLHNESLKEKIIQQTKIVDRKAQENQIQRHLIKIETLEAELFLSLRCSRCHDLLQKPHTYIPCGHSVCEKCLKPSCQKNGCSNTEVVYRNTQFDELIKIYHIVKETKTFIKGCLLQC